MKKNIISKVNDCSYALSSTLINLYKGGHISYDDFKKYVNMTLPYGTNIDSGKVFDYLQENFDIEITYEDCYCGGLETIITIYNKKGD